MKKVMLFVMGMTAASFANWGYESRAILERIASSLEKIEKHLAKNCETPKATPVSHFDNTWSNYTYDAKNVNHPLKAKATHDEDDDRLMRCADKCDNLYDKDEERLIDCLDDCIARY